MRRTLVPLAIAVLLALSSTGQAADQKALEYEKAIERFQFYNACQPMVLAVGHNAAAGRIGVKKKALHAAVESRLRAARLYTDSPTSEGSAALTVKVDVVGEAFDISVQYIKVLTDEFGTRVPSMAWGTSSFGTHGRDATGLVAYVSEHLDKFLAAYLRVNEDDCHPR